MIIINSCQTFYLRTNTQESCTRLDGLACETITVKNDNDCQELFLSEVQIHVSKLAP